MHYSNDKRARLLENCRNQDRGLADRVSFQNMMMLNINSILISIIKIVYSVRLVIQYNILYMIKSLRSSVAYRFEKIY
jgi:hypothetical protein